MLSVPRGHDLSLWVPPPEALAQQVSQTSLQVLPGVLPSGFQTCPVLTSAACSNPATQWWYRSLWELSTRQGQRYPGTWVKNMDSVLLVSSSDRCSGLRWPGLLLWWDMVSSLCTVESEQMGGSGTKGRWDRERPSRPSMGISGSRGLLLVVDSSLVGAASDSGISFEGDLIVGTDR